ncbi:hypothetical protein Q4Q91_19225 [Morganella morganii]
MLLIWRPFAQPRRIITTVNRDDLMDIGNRLLEAQI